MARRHEPSPNIAFIEQAAENTKLCDDTTDNLHADATVDPQTHDGIDANGAARVTSILDLPDDLLLKIVKHLLRTRRVHHFFPARIPNQRSRPTGI